jgi:hypothetical protein
VIGFDIDDAAKNFAFISGKDRAPMSLADPATDIGTTTIPASDTQTTPFRCLSCPHRHEVLHFDAGHCLVAILDFDTTQLPTIKLPLQMRSQVRKPAGFCIPNQLLAASYSGGWRSMTFQL